MSEEFGPEFISITDEDGNEFELEYVETIEYQGRSEERRVGKECP